ncbi:MAG: bile acid:sodium symporter [Desulfobacteraceae bacterium]|nr:bile acid:sodium symporter [Desulfobacteraceae bacterium]
MDTIKKQWFLCGLVLIFFSVIFDRTGNIALTGIFIKNHSGSSVMIVCIFLLSGMILDIDQIKSGLKDAKSTFAALLLIVVVSPFVAAVMSFLPLETGIILGLFLVAVMPTTLSSGVVMTGNAGGNMAHALFVTIVSNCFAIVSIPLVLSILLAMQQQSTELCIDQKAILIKLMTLVLLPLLTAILLKKMFLKITASQKKIMGIINQCCVICIIFMSLSGVKELLLSKGSSFFLIIPLVIVFHMCLLGFSCLVTWLFNIGKGKRESVIFMGSQKTLPLAVMLQMTYFSEYGTALLVCVVHHITHLMIDGYLAVKFKQV